MRLLTCPKVLFPESWRFMFCCRLCDTSNLQNANRVLQLALLFKIVCATIEHFSVTIFTLANDTADKMLFDKLLEDTASIEAH